MEKIFEFCCQQIVLHVLYLVTALFAKHSITTHTHTGVKSVFGLKFIKEGIVENKWGKLLATLFDKRQLGDYGYFAYLVDADVLPLLKEVEEFKQVILKLIRE